MHAPFTVMIENKGLVLMLCLSIFGIIRSRSRKSGKKIEGETVHEEYKMTSEIN